MQASSQFIRLASRVLLVLALVFVAPGLLAGSKVKVKGDVEEVAGDIEGAFEELEITPDEATVTTTWAKATGKARSGARVTVAVNTLGEDECEVSIDSDSPADPEVEERFLRLMQSR